MVSIMEPSEVTRLKDRAKEILERLFGLFSVWNYKVTGIYPENEKFVIKGVFTEDYEGQRQHSFMMKLDRYGRLIDVAIS